jgi:hypothetical protein
MKRGDVQVSSHPNYTLYADPRNMEIGGVGHEQFVIIGNIFKTLNYKNHNFADGMMGKFLKDNYEINYCPEAFILFNYLEKGRYNDNMM